MISKNRIKFIKSLQTKKNRYEEQLFVVEGEKLVMEALNWVPDQIIQVIHTKEFENQPKLNSIEFVEISYDLLREISTLTTPNKALAILRFPKISTPSNSLHFVIDGVQDPGNLGTIIRLADWFGMKHLVCSNETVDCYNPKVLQATMGSIFRVDVHYTNLETYLSTSNQPTYGAFMEGENIFGTNINENGIIILGNEGNGISDSLKKYIHYPITIPKFGNAESLNVAMAGSIILSSFFQQKHSHNSSHQSQQK